MNAVKAIANRPQQARSQATLERLVVAAKRLVESRDWSDISMAEIAREAKSSIGSLYARFESKQALLDYLDEDYTRATIAFCQEHGPDFAHAQGSLAAFVERMAKDLVDFHIERPGLIRALVMETRAHRPAAFTERTGRMNETAVSLYEAFETFAADLPGPNKKQAITWSIFMLWSLTRERLLFPESIPAPGHDAPDDIAAQIAHAILGYLRNTPPSPTSKGE